MGDGRDRGSESASYTHTPKHVFVCVSCVCVRGRKKKERKKETQQTSRKRPPAATTETPILREHSSSTVLQST